MQMTITQFKDIYSALLKLKQMDLPTTLAFKVARNIGKGEHDAKSFDEGMRNLQLKNAKRDESGELAPDEHGNIFIDPAKIQDYYKEYDEFMNTMIDVDFRTMSEFEFSKVESIQPQILVSLGLILEDGGQS